MAQVPSVRLKDRSCPSHSSSQVAMVCTTCDDQHVCLECIATTHSGHHFWTLEKHVQTEKEKTTVLTEQAEEKLNSGHEKLKKIEEAKQENMKHTEHILKEITDYLTILKAAIEKWTTVHMYTCEKNGSTNKGLLEAVESNLKDKTYSLQEVFDAGKSALESSTYEEYAALNAELRQTIALPFDIMPVIQKQQFKRPETIDREIQVLCGRLEQFDFEHDEPSHPEEEILQEPIYIEPMAPLVMPTVPARPCPALPKRSESCNGNIFETFTDGNLMKDYKPDNSQAPVINIGKVTKSSVYLSWDKLGSYTIERRRRGLLKNWQKCADVTKETTSITISDVKEGQDIQFRFVYIDDNAQEKRSEPTKFIKISSSNMIDEPNYEGFNDCTLKANASNPDIQRSSFYLKQENDAKVRTIVCANADHKTNDGGELSYLKNDFIELVDDNNNGDNETLHFGRNLVSREYGRVTSIGINCVTLDSCLGYFIDQRFSWWYHVNREDAEAQLLYPTVPMGTFLMRLSSDKTDFVLSVRDDDKVKHYKILSSPDGFCITARKYFHSISELVAFYKGAQDGLCQVLSDPLPKLLTVDLGIISDEKVNINQKLCDGMFSTVFSGVHTDMSGSAVMVKVFKPGSSLPHEMLKEAKILQSLDHSQIAKVSGICPDNGPKIVMQCEYNGSLLDYLRKGNGGQQILLSNIVDMAAQMASVLSYIGQKGMVLTDLRAANWTVGMKSKLKLVNVELAEYTTNGVFQGREGRKFPFKWTAPEAVFSKTFTVKSDVWSYGVVLYELITLGKTPYQGLGGLELLRELDKGYRIPRETKGPIEWPDDYYNLMKSCWFKDPQARPSFQHLYECLHKF